MWWNSALNGKFIDWFDLSLVLAIIIIIIYFWFFSLSKMGPVSIFHFIVSLSFHVSLSGFYVYFCRLYTFDVHCNSFYPMFVLLYGNTIFKHITQSSQNRISAKRDCIMTCSFFLCCCSRSLFSITTPDNSRIHPSTAIEFAFHGRGLVLPLS